MTLLGRLKAWLRGLIGDVPADNEACEFGCREGECSYERWESCERRLKWKHLHERLAERERSDDEQWPPAAATGDGS